MTTIAADAPEPAPFRIQNEGTLLVIYPQTPEATAWLNETAPEDAQWWAGGLVVEPRYVQGVLDAWEAR